MYIFCGSPAVAPFPDQFQQSFALSPNVALMKPRSWTVGGFAQDDWRVNRRLTINLGARYDVELIRDMPGYNAPADKNNVDPRLGIAWDPIGDSAWIVLGGVERFTQQQLMFTLSRGGLAGPNGIVQLTIPAGVSGFPTFPNALPSFLPGTVLPPRNIERISDSLQNEFGIQTTAGVQHELRPRTIASIDFVYAKGWKQGPARSFDDLAHASLDRSRNASSGLHLDLATAGRRGPGEGEDDWH